MEVIKITQVLVPCRCPTLACAGHWTRLRSEVSVLPRSHVAVRQKAQIPYNTNWCTTILSQNSTENQYFISQLELSLSYHKMLYI